MLVDLEDGHCRTCKGQLEIEDITDCTLELLCQECGDSYSVETDAFGDGCMKYFFQMQIDRLEEDDDE